MRRRLLAMVMASALAVSMLAGCGGGNSGDAGNAGDADEGGAGTGASVEVDFDEEPYEATFMYWAANDARDVDAVEAAFNELTMAQLNMKVDLVPITLGTYFQQIQMVLTSDDPLDIVPIFASNAGGYISADYIVDMAPYIDTIGADMVNIVGKEDIECCTIGDFLWGIPTMHERCNPTGYIMRTDILEETGINPDDIKTIFDLTPLFAKVKELHPEMTVYGGTNTATQPASETTFDPLGSGNFGVLMNSGQDLTVTNWYESDKFREEVELMYEWAQAGYTSQDFATCTDPGESLMRAGNLFCFNAYVKPNTKIEKDSQTGYDTTIVQVTGNNCYTSVTNALGYAISANAKDPEKAMQLLNWIYKTKEANDLINWGIEGKDYVVLEDGTIDYPEGVTAENVGYHQDFGWAQPNQYNSYIWTGNDPDVWEQYQKVRDGATVSKAYGFTFDATLNPAVNDAVGALNAVVEQYVATLCTGSVDPETGIKEFNDALYAAGLQDVIDEKQAQLDAWLAEQ